ncbi:Thiol-disulfide isomerase or thioredoxin [Paenibacillus uliginis N3/975]|uniref:Thiol-disulfide isomerase or thioredoxin n=1 Tax=Paenibacillus uliginis N3/975 TaxID=1313296 RepID=A0A1X7H2V5_9BACL|nr:TlpA disulfide reductase family protein [Paenibacillus uliginis]SMF78615.1 Thiol-disulfide isomerase or thioredoxin [Paenibacillus uliginis N3/975]
MKRNLTILAILLLAGVLVIYNQAGDKIESVFMAEKPLPTETGAKAGLLAPAFSLEGLDGKTYTGDGVRDKALIINFWASWCDPCKQEAPELSKFASAYAEDLDVYGINVTKYDNEKKARQFVQDFALTYPIMFDQEGKVFEDVYKGKVFPTNVLIDRRGVITEIILGAPDPEDLEKKIKKLIKS